MKAYSISSPEQLRTAADMAKWQNDMLSLIHISNVWIESYRRDETRDIATIVSQFLSWLRENDYDQLYFERWCAR